MFVSYAMPFRGGIEVICGGMFSGKTEELLRRLKRAVIARQKVQVFKPVLDQRYSSSHVQSHDQSKMKSVVVKKAEEILARIEDTTRVVGIDEAQFFDSVIVSVVQKLANRGLRVIVAGLDLDYLGKPFGSMPALLAFAESVTKLSAVCVLCGAPASRTQRKHVSKKTLTQGNILVGAQEFYEARCRFCHQVDALEVIPERERNQEAKGCENRQEGENRQGGGNKKELFLKRAFKSKEEGFLKKSSLLENL